MTLASATDLKILTPSTGSGSTWGWADDDEFQGQIWGRIGSVNEALNTYEGSFANGTAPQPNQFFLDPFIATRNFVKIYRSSYGEIVTSGVVKFAPMATASSGFRKVSSVAFIRENTGATQKPLSLAMPQHAPDPLASYERYAAANWDAEGAEPITNETVDYARHMMRLLPDTLGIPDIAPSADGSIGFEWVPDHGPLAKLFMDVGPGAQWHAYWQRENGEIGRLSGAEIQPQTRTVLRNLFADLSM